MHISTLTNPFWHLLHDHPFLTTALLLPTTLLLYLLINEVVRYAARNHDFKGPPNRLLVGNLPDITTNASETLRKWADTYGDVYEMQLGNVPVIVVNSAAAAKELFGAKGHVLNSRPVFYTFHKIVAKTAGSTIGTSPISDSLKRRRRAAAAALNRPAVASYAGHLDFETMSCVKNLFEAGDAGRKAIEPKPHIQRFALCMALTVNWGTRLASQDEQLFREIIEVEKGIVSTRDRTQNMKDYIPLLRLMPFSSKAKKAKDWRERRDVYLEKFDRELREQIEKGTHKPSIQANAILDPESKLSKAELSSISVSIIQGGNDTVSGTLDWSIAFLAQHPEIQNRALAEIRQHYSDDDILCSASGEKKLPYLSALVQECLRYFTVLRLSLPRCTTQEMAYNNRRIRKGSTIWLNAWACNMDPQLWSDPLVFRPERWIENPDAPLFTYGLGYRMCAGYNLANREVELFLMRTICCFEILRGEGEDVDVVNGGENASAGGRSPRKYSVFFRPRDEEKLREAITKKEVELGIS